MGEKIAPNQIVGTPITPANPKLKVAMLSVLGLVLVGGLVFAGYKLKQKQVQLTPALPQAVIPSPTPQSETGGPLDETANWKTYKNEKYGVEFKYPQNFMVTEGRGQYFINQKPLIELESETFNLLTNQLEALFTVTVKSNAKSDCEYVPRGNLDTLQDRVVNGVKFSLFSNTGAAAGSKYSSTIYHYLDDTTCYEIVTTIVEANDGNSSEGISKIEEQRNIFNTQLDQILSTFKFLD